MQDIIAIGANAMDMIDRFGEPTIIISARILFHKLFEAVLVQLFVFHMEILVLLHVCLVLEGELASTSIAMEMSGFLASKRTIMSGTIFATSKAKKAFTLDGIVFAMIIEVHLDVRSGDVHLVTMT